MLIRNLVYRLGSEPKKSWSTFKLGLIIFVVGAVFILLGAQFTYWLQIPGFILLLVGGLCAIKGYVGIFANRFAKTIERIDAASALSNKNNHLD
jgi:drug/metabolite transporter (DMT)-like permease